jgi:hypothetical protein
MADFVPRREGRRPPLTPPKLGNERRNAERADSVIGLLRDLVHPDRLLLGTIAVLLTIGTTFVFCFGTRPSYGYAMLAVTTSVIVVIVMRSIRNGPRSGGRGGASGR